MFACQGPLETFVPQTQRWNNKKKIINLFCHFVRKTGLDAVMVSLGRNMCTIWISEWLH